MVIFLVFDKTIVYRLLLNFHGNIIKITKFTIKNVSVAGTKLVKWQNLKFDNFRSTEGI